jgi:hypothetical protein
MEKIEVLVKITIEEEKNDCGLYGEYLEKTMKQVEKDGIHLEDYAVIHPTSISTEEMYYNYLMNHVLKNDFDMDKISPMSYNEWMEKRGLNNDV